MDTVRVGRQQARCVGSESDFKTAHDDLAPVAHQAHRQAGCGVDRHVLDPDAVATLGKHGAAVAAR